MRLPGRMKRPGGASGKSIAGVTAKLQHFLLDRLGAAPVAGKAADSIRAAEVCAGVKPGEIVIFDRAYVDFCIYHDILSRFHER